MRPALTGFPPLSVHHCPCSSSQLTAAALCVAPSLSGTLDLDPRAKDGPSPSVHPSQSNCGKSAEDGGLFRLGREEARAGGQGQQPGRRSFSRSRRQRVGVEQRSRAQSGTSGPAHSDTSEFPEYWINCIDSDNEVSVLGSL